MVFSLSLLNARFQSQLRQQLQALRPVRAVGERERDRAVQEDHQRGRRGRVSVRAREGREKQRGRTEIMYGRLFRRLDTMASI